jgi:hypothetical protein
MLLRHVVVFACVAGLVPACVTEEAGGDPAAEPELLASIDQAASLAFSREHVGGDLYHYELVLPLGSAPNAAVRVHRIVREAAPWVPRATPRAAMLLHGDFSTFVTNFAPALGDPASPVAGLAPYLAARDIDVWGVDRRWTLPGAAGDVSDFATMGVAQEIDDLRAALALARAVRTVGGSGAGRLALVGFSHGAQLAYAYASVEAARPAAQRHVGALVPLDWYGAYGPEQEGERAATCELGALEYQLVAGGVIDAPNDFLIAAGQLARTAPGEPSPLLEGMTNREAMLLTVGQTYLFAPYAPFYHLLSPILEGDAAVGLREAAEPAATAWLAGATAHQAMIEAADLDALLCGEGAPPVDAPLSRIRVPLLYIGAAGGVGDLGVYATTRVASTDVTALVVRRFGADRRAEDFGHADLLFAADAPALVWQPLAAWLAQH